MKSQPLDFPEDIIYEILTNLPVKSLLRFKCVSKQWRRSISSKVFMREHLKKSRTDFARHKLILSSVKASTSSFKYCPLKYVLGEKSMLPNSDHHPIAEMHPWSPCTRINGSSNGIVLMSHNNSTVLILWNPSTREAKNVPPPSFAPTDFATSLLYGFWYDESADDCKVVCILPDSKPCPTEMYSSRTGSWREIAKFDKGKPVKHCDKLVNGRLHWVARREGRWDIVSLHPVEEKYEVVPRPKYIPHDHVSDLALANLGGDLDCLSLITRDRWWVDMNVWVMKRYGEAESWIKIWALSDFDEPTIYPLIYPFWMTKDGDIALVNGTVLIVVYDGENRKCKSRVDMVGAIINGPRIYVESLASPFGDEGPAEGRK